MKPKHVEARIKQCLAIAECSPCPRRKFGALLLDPIRNVLLMDGYNGGPRGGGEICGGSLCLRDGIARSDLLVSHCANTYVAALKQSFGEPGWYIHHRLVGIAHLTGEKTYPTKEEAEAAADALAARYPPIRSGTMYEIGCHHAEMNVITNAAARGVATTGAWLIVTGEPCVLCAKLIHHAGIVRVLCVKGGFVGGDDGPAYLRAHGVEVEYVDGPPDPRATPK